MKRYITSMVLGLMSIVMVAGCSSDDKSSDKPTEPEKTAPVAIEKTNSTKIYMHYMPWFETNESSADKKWGYHWTMANKKPNNVGANGRREIASYYYPLIGPYHSGDKNVIENHLLLMKYSGIDGILIDWYGTYDVNDYRMVKENTDQLIEMLDKVGLEYAIVYEDRFLTNVVNAGKAISVTSAAKTDLAYVQNNYFTDANYIKINGKPLLMNFGPIVLQTPAEWTNVFNTLTTKPTFLTLWDHSVKAGDNASGEYAWVYKDNSFLTNFYTNTKPKLGVAMGSAYPGFKDFYAEGGGGAAIGWTIDHKNGATLDETLTLAKNANVNYLQLITWNDFGEGTMIEPTAEFGYSFIEKIKTFAGVKNTENIFPDISKLYDLRVQKKGNADAQKKLNQAFNYFVSMQPAKAKQIMSEIK
ncbi:glycoside hydrolase family 71/99-like protein [Flavobacterium johnsoniae]|uniref:glycoside hydrolase family 71/99-like protein n=1 Tax=Flavobacterium johnsoniae TaxID=986 RepID=UPI0025AFEC12|nr:glycoside hydrolase family 71/99-like protein [Flavobacterium johnsoniae]WJS94444.1 glycoside hydrolase family 71/99-like protein [Flavobacterium johnsoniae]